MKPSVAAEAGSVLRQRREELGLTPQQAAAQLNLKATVIQQLESGQWDSQIAPTFIRGYLRLYTRLLRLETAGLLAALDQQLAAMPVASEMHSFSNKSSRDVAENRFMLATYFLLVLLIGLFLVWFWQTHMLNEQPAAVIADQTVVNNTQPQTEPTTVMIRSDDAQVEMSAGNAATVSALSTEVSQPPAQAQAENAHVATTASAELIAASPASESPTEQTNPTAADATQPQTLHNTTTSSGTTGTPAGTVGTEAASQQVEMNTAADTSRALPLMMQFNAQCWVTITDATGKRLVYRMLQNGESVSLHAVPPLRIVLGDPAAVTASLGGKAIDLSSYKQGQVVRLTLTGSE